MFKIASDTSAADNSLWTLLDTLQVHDVVMKSVTGAGKIIGTSTGDEVMDECLVTLNEIEIIMGDAMQSESVLDFGQSSMEDRRAGTHSMMTNEDSMYNVRRIFCQIIIYHIFYGDMGCRCTGTRVIRTDTSDCAGTVDRHI